MKAKFATDPAGHVSLEYDATDYDGVTRRITRVFLAPSAAVTSANILSTANPHRFANA